jgi:hypothetical protein
MAASPGVGFIETDDIQERRMVTDRSRMYDDDDDSYYRDYGRYHRKYHGDYDDDDMMMMERDRRGYRGNFGNTWEGQTSYYRPGPSGERRQYAGDKPLHHHLDEFEHDDDDEFDDEYSGDLFSDKELCESLRIYSKKFGETSYKSSGKTIRDDDDDAAAADEYYSDDDYDNDDDDMEFRHSSGDKMRRRGGRIRNNNNNNNNKENRPRLYKKIANGRDNPEEGLGSLVGKGVVSPSSSSKKGKMDCCLSSEPITISSPLSPKEVARETKAFIEETHASLRSYYSGSVTSNGMRQKLAAKIKPVYLKASAESDVLDSGKSAIVINEEKFKEFQSKVFKRDKKRQQEFKANAIRYFKELTGLDFSRNNNPKVKKMDSSLCIGDEAKMIPYIIGSKEGIQIKVNAFKGFPSLQQGDSLTESGYKVDIKKKTGLKVYGTYGGEKGKTLTPGQSFFYGEIMISPPNKYRMPEWIRIVSKKPSEITVKNTSSADLNVRRISLFQNGTVEQLFDHEGEATRVLKIELLKDDNGKNVAKKVTTDFKIHFD